MPRVTANYLKDWLQKEFDRLEIKLTVKDAYATRYSDEAYQNGAASYILKAGTRGSNDDALIFCFIQRSELQEALDGGKKLYWQPEYIAKQVVVNDSKISFR